VGALLEKHPEHAACLEALEESQAPFTDAHALAETFATLTGFYNWALQTSTLSPFKPRFLWAKEPS